MQENLKITPLKRKRSGKRILRKENLKGKMQARAAENQTKSQKERVQKEDLRRE
jgi:hypothetical protein